MSIQSCRSVKNLTVIVVTNSQYSRRETIELNLVPADITEDVLEENICKALSLTGVNIVPN